MTRNGPNDYTAPAGEVVRITINSVSFDINADLDPELAPVGPINDFCKAGELTIGSADTTFAIAYNFPDPLPAEGKYTYTVTGSGGFSDGPLDVVQIGDEPTQTLAYTVRLARVAALGGGTGSE